MFQATRKMVQLRKRMIYIAMNDGKDILAEDLEIPTYADDESNNDNGKELRGSDFEYPRKLKNIEF